MSTEPINRVSFEAAQLIKDHPPRWRHPNKEIVFQIACTPGVPFKGEVSLARWPTAPLPLKLPTPGKFTVQPNVYAYRPSADPTEIAWHVNFADPHLFVAYGTSLMAQDELQVAEHPILGSLREALDASRLPAETVSQTGEPTPITITGAERRCLIDTRPNPLAGCLFGLYGNEFARATGEQIRAATHPIVPPTVSNILAIAAPGHGRGEYTRDQVLRILTTAFTGFSAAHQESLRLHGAESSTVIHTGFWGCGAFGGNRTLMTLLQVCAADLAGVEVQYWTVDHRGSQVAKDAYQLYTDIRTAKHSLEEVIEDLLSRHFVWGVSNGT